MLFYTINGYCIAGLITQQRIEGLFGVFMELISADVGNVRFSRVMILSFGGGRLLTPF